MMLSNFDFQTVDWSQVETELHAGEAGTATWRTRHFGGIRVRMVEYSAGYRADHWCKKGHLLLCLQGELHTTLRDGREVVLGPSMAYYVADDTMPHRSSAPLGATLYIVD